MMPEAYSDPNDIRFGYEVIRNLAESVRQQSEVLRGVQQTQITMLERLARIESNRVNEDVARLQLIMESQDKRIDVLEQDKDLRDGGSLMRKALVTWWPVIAATAMVFWLLFRASGIIHMPSDNPTVIIPPPPRLPHGEGMS